MACGRRFLRAAESRAPGAVVMAVGICPRYAISSHPARAVLPFLSGSCQKTSICCQRLAKGLPFPAKNCNSLPGFRTYQRLTGEWQGKIGDEAVRRYLADPTTPILGSDFLSVQALALQSSRPSRRLAGANSMDRTSGALRCGSENKRRTQCQAWQENVDRCRGGRGWGWCAGSPRVWYDELWIWAAEEAEFKQLEAAALLGVSERTFRRWQGGTRRTGGWVVDRRLGKGGSGFGRREQEVRHYDSVMRGPSQAMSREGHGRGTHGQDAQGAGCRRRREGRATRKRERRPLPGMSCTDGRDTSARRRRRSTSCDRRRDGGDLGTGRGGGYGIDVRARKRRRAGLPMSLYTERGSHTPYRRGGRQIDRGA